MSCQPGMDDLNQQRVADELIRLAALGWAVRKAEACGIHPTPDYAELHRMADQDCQWKKAT